MVVFVRCTAYTISLCASLAWWQTIYPIKCLWKYSHATRKLQISLVLTSFPTADNYSHNHPTTSQYIAHQHHSSMCSILSACLPSFICLFLGVKFETKTRKPKLRTKSIRILVFPASFHPFSRLIPLNNRTFWKVECICMCATAKWFRSSRLNDTHVIHMVCYFFYHSIIQWVGVYTFSLFISILKQIHLSIDY